jgi:PqqA peptide cyclase
VRIAAPLAILAELTHRCHLRCGYCSNPVELERASGELDTDVWRRVLDEAAELGALHVHLSGGEPALRRDLEPLVAHAALAGLYTNLITSGVGLARGRIEALAEAGLEHVQLSIQHTQAERGDAIAGRPGAHAHKLEVAAAIREVGLPLTVNVVLHRGNLDEVPALVALALALGARRIELAHVQLYGWALVNRAELLPGEAQVMRALEQIEHLASELSGELVIDHVPPDHLARRPKACMGGWGRRFLAITPSGRVLPCHAAESIPGLEVPSLRNARGEPVPLRDIWERSAAFQRFRGTDWMLEPCRSCARREIDFGGCRCQALAFAGDARVADPACERSAHHGRLRGLATAVPDPSFVPLARAMRRSTVRPDGRSGAGHERTEER